MTGLTASDLACMRTTQATSFMDECYRMVYTPGASGSYGKKKESYVQASTPLACAVGYLKAGSYGGGTASAEVMDQVSLFSTYIRLPYDATITHKDRIKVTKRFGEDITPITYEIIGEIRRGPTALIVDVQKVTDGSEV